MFTGTTPQCFQPQLSNVSPFSTKRRFRDLRPHPLREMDPLKREFFGDANTELLHALSQRIADVSDMVDNAFTRNEILSDMKTAWDLYDGSRALETLNRSGASASQAMTSQKLNVPAKLTQLNKIAEEHIRIRIRSALRHAEMLRRLGVAKASAQAGLTGRPHGMHQRPLTFQTSRRDPGLGAAARGSVV